MSHKIPDEETCTECSKIWSSMNTTETIEYDCPHKKKRLSYTKSELPPIAFSLVIINQQNEKIFEKYHVGANSASYLLELLKSKEKDFEKYIDARHEMLMTAADRRRYESTTHCRSCNIFFDSSTIKCRDHDHFTSKFRGALCANCNLQKKNLLFIPLYAHNLRKFDSHLIIKAKTDKSIPMSTLSNNREQVITITLGNIFSFFY